jgi:transaldolase
LTDIFLDTASASEAREFLSWGIGDGVTTNQKIFLSEGNVDFKGRVLEICSLKARNWPVSVETTSHGYEALLQEAREYASWHRNVVVKVAMYGDGTGLKVVRTLSQERIKTNMTCMVTFDQLLMAAKAGATYVSLFFNRARDAGLDPVRAIREIVAELESGGYKSKLIVGSIRRPLDVEEAAAAGAHIITITPKVLREMALHQKTEDTIKEFDDAWKEFLEQKEKRTEEKAVASALAPAAPAAATGAESSGAPGASTGTGQGAPGS